MGSAAHVCGSVMVNDVNVPADEINLDRIGGDFFAELPEPFQRV